MHHFGTVSRNISSFLSICVLILLTFPAQAREIEIAQHTSAASLNEAIASAAPGDQIVFGEGIHHFTENLIINRDDITLRGALSGKTILRFASQTGDFVTVVGGKMSKPVALKRGARKNSFTIHLSKSLGLKAGDAVYLQRPNTKRFIAQWENVKWSEAERRPFRESIHRIRAVDDLKITLETPLPFAMPAKSATLQKITLNKGVTLSNLTIESDLAHANPNDFSNSLAEFSGASSLRALRTEGLVLDNITINNSPSSAFILSSSINAKINGLTIRGAHNKGGGGNGYGVELHEAFYNELTNLRINDMRHAIILSAWHAEVGNRIHVIETNRDINFHGSLDHSNEVFVENIKLAYAPDRSSKKRRNVWKVVSAGGTNHAETDFLAVNKVAFVKATGSWRNDTLIGVNGSEMSGGFGADRFVVAENAIILDFEKNDVLSIQGDASKLVLKQDGKDTLVSFNGDKQVRLIGVNKDDLTPSNFDPSRAV